MPMRRKIGVSRKQPRARKTGTRRPQVENLEGRTLFSANLVGAFAEGNPASIAPVGKTKFTLTLNNTGDATAAGPATVSLFASLDDTLDNSDPMLLRFSNRLGIKAGKSSKLKLTVPAPTGIADGDYHLFAVVDGTAIPSVSSTVTTESAATVGIRQPFVDLSATMTASPVTPIAIVAKHQKPTKLTLLLQNAGNVVARGAIAIEVYSASSPTLDGGATLMFTWPAHHVSVPANGLKPKILKISGKPAVGVPSGNRYVVAKINSNNGIAESDTTNNLAVSSGTVSINNPAVPAGPSLTGALGVDFSRVVVGSSQVVHFSIPVSGATSDTQTEVDEVDSAGNSLGKLVDARDDGSLLYGDAVAGDGIFSGVINVDFSATGQRFFTAAVTDTSLAGPLHGTATVITGVTPPTPAQLQADATALSAIQQVTDSATNAGGSAQAVLDAVNAALQSDPNVQPGSIGMGNGVIEWQNVDGTIHLVDTTYASQTAAADPPVSSGLASLASLARSSPAATHAVALADGNSLPLDATKNAVIISPFGYDLDTRNAAATVAAQLQGKGLTVTNFINGTVTDNKVTALAFTGLNQYGFIDINSHGDLGPDGNVYIATGEHDSLATAANYLGDLADNSMVTMTVPNLGSFFAIAPAYITKHNTGLNHSVVFAGTCFGGANGTMANAFLRAGAAAYISFDNKASNRFVLDKQTATVTTLVADTKNTVGDIVGINRDHDYAAPRGLFRSFGDLTATLPLPDKLSDTALYIQYSWPQTQKDLDTNTAFLGDVVGFDHAFSGTYLNWTGDDTSSGGFESVTVDIGQAFLDGKWQNSTTVSYGADWYTSAGGQGSATVTIGLKDTSTNELTEVTTRSVNPGKETSGSTTVFGNVTIALSGDPLNPTVSINV